VLEGLQKLGRLQAKQALRLEELESKIEGGFADLRAQLEEAQRPAGDVDWADLLDAMDALDEAARLAAATPEVAAGLRAVLQRMDRFLGDAGVERRIPVGAPPDGRLFRVVGAEPDPALPDGVVARVVRAAVLRGDEILREGEVIVTRRDA
jgi:molecular chaperone GrpE (heat shock protein)